MQCVTSWSMLPADQDLALGIDLGSSGARPCPFACQHPITRPPLQTCRACQGQKLLAEKTMRKVPESG